MSTTRKTGHPKHSTPNHKGAHKQTPSTTHRTRAWLNLEKNLGDLRAIVDLQGRDGRAHFAKTKRLTTSMSRRISAASKAGALSSADLKSLERSGARLSKHTGAYTTSG